MTKVLIASFCMLSLLYIFKPDQEESTVIHKMEVNSVKSNQNSGVHNYGRSSNIGSNMDVEERIYRLINSNPESLSELETEYLNMAKSFVKGMVQLTDLENDPLDEQTETKLKALFLQAYVNRMEKIAVSIKKIEGRDLENLKQQGFSLDFSPSLTGDSEVGDKVNPSSGTPVNFDDMEVIEIKSADILDARKRANEYLEKKAKFILSEKQFELLMASQYAEMSYPIKLRVDKWDPLGMPLSEAEMYKEGPLQITCYKSKSDGGLISGVFISSPIPNKEENSKSPGADSKNVSRPAR